ncbi:Pentatricopeptide repeat-containing protein, chloroplastic [Vitis vinifera]|uniref:Pentatricopeptide repeat-containing protein, chloroplastic n=1 Tax=Vitis vinifera TaxID=29760 RepID=A0A438DUQ9_VITVI|nr:Pentatricopeptide repeat-containing protein, chloroplastic [Vitis vinifera]
MSSTATTATEAPYHHHHLIPKGHSTETSKLSHKAILHLLNTQCTTSLHHLKQAHALILRTGHLQDSYIAGSLVKSYANVCIENNEPFKAILLYYEMVVAHSRPNKYTYPAVLKACSDAGVVAEGVQVHAHLVKHGLGGDGHILSSAIRMYASFGRLVEARRILDDKGGEVDAVCWNAMIDGYLRFGEVEAARELFEGMPDRSMISTWNAMISGFSRCGMVEVAREFFDEMKERDEISWSAMIDGYIQEGCFMEALEIFHQMQKEKIRPRKFVLPSVLSACANLGALDQGRWIHTYAKRNSIQLDGVLGTSLVDMYAKCGRIDLAWEVFEKMSNKEVSSWNAMIGGWLCTGRALTEAEKVVSSIPTEPTPAVWGALLGACRKHGTVELGERVGKILLELEPQNSGRYTLLSNIYAKAGRWEEVGEVRKLMKERGIKTTPGTSIIDLGRGEVHKFIIGDGSHPQVKDIYQMLDKVKERLQMEGYEPDPSQVLFDIDEEEKETAVWQHSEKLAIGFGLINTSPGTTIRIVKNLRVCEDCHSATKLISQVYNREIIVRDRIRYHHFRNGACSCKDFW